MKVLFIVTAYPRHEGDVITPWMGETIDRLRMAGTEVEVLAPSYRGSRTGTIGGVKVHRFRYAPARLETLTHDVPALDRIAANPLFAALLPSYLAAGSAAAARIAREGEFDVVHAFWPIPHGLFAIAAKRASRAALVSTFFSSELNWTGPARGVFGPLLRSIVRASDAVTVISSHTAARLREHVPGAQSVTVPFGAAAVSRTDSSGSATVVRRRDDPFELLFVGRLVRRKGVDVLLRAVALIASDARLHLRIVGGGPEKENLIAASEALGLGNRVTFEGVVDKKRVNELFETCDALVLPAIVTATGETEGLGVVLIEAMGYGKPVIAASAGGIVDIICDGDTGLLVPPGDAVSLAVAISKAMDDPAELAMIASRGAAYAGRAFGWNTIVSRLLSVYESAIAAKIAAKRLARIGGH
ncbi:MAG: glycosyltransferase [Gemmatimonadaceae bacterium]|nr:glycosyltransferase [Gemmatimonadaceae bacterium]